MEFNLRELILTSFNRMYCSKQLGCHGHNLNSQFSKAPQTTLNLSIFKMIEAVGLETIASRSP
jgi:hypothetical protein